MASLTEPSPAATSQAALLDGILNRLTALEMRKSLAHASIDGGNLPIYDRDGNLQMTVGLLPDGTFGPNYYNPNPPPIPAAPTVTPTWGGLMIAHFGTTADGGEWPMDVSRIEIHMSSLEVFFPSEATLVGTFTGVTGGGLYAAMGLDPSVTYWVRLVAVNTSEKKSAATAPVSGTPDSVVSQEVLDQIDADLEDAVNDLTDAVSTRTGVYYNNTTTGDPVPVGNTAGDTWFRPDEGYRPYRWDGDSWEPFSLGDLAIADGAITTEKLGPGAVTGGSLDEALLGTINQSSRDASDALADTAAVTFRVDIAEETLDALGQQADDTADLVTAFEVRILEAETQAGETANFVTGLASLVTKTTTTRHHIF